MPAGSLLIVLIFFRLHSLGLGGPWQGLGGPERSVSFFRANRCRFGALLLFFFGFAFSLACEKVAEMWSSKKMRSYKGFLGVSGFLKVSWGGWEIAMVKKG